MSTPRNILIIRLSAIGDVVMASPLIRAIHRTWPGTKISWLSEESSRSVLEANSELEELIVWPRGRWRQYLRQAKLWPLAKEMFAFISDLRKRRYDLTIDAQGLLKSGIWAYLSGAPERIGLGSREGSRILMTRFVDRSGASDRISSQYLLLAQEMGLDTSDFSMHVALSREAREFADRFADSLSSPYAIFAPFTTRPQKHWIDGRWQELRERITAELGLSVVLLGGPGDVEASKGILPEEKPRGVNLTGKTSLQETAAVIRNASLLIGVDTGLTHMGIALDTPTIALFGATLPYRDTRGTSGTVLYHHHDCSPCRRSPTCDGLFPCMDAISADEIIRTARVLLRL